MENYLLKYLFKGKNVNMPLISFPQNRFGMKIIIHHSKIFPLSTGTGKKPIFTIKSRFYRKIRFFAHTNAKRENFKTQRVFFLSNLSWENHEYCILTFSCFKKVLCLVIFHLITDPLYKVKLLKSHFFKIGS